MFSPQRKLIFVALLFCVLFVAGMVHLFLLRFEAGDVYPPYSSLRSDPLGTQALFESLGRTSTGSVHRNFRALHQAKLGENTTLMILGVKERNFFWGGIQYEELLENLAQSGGRLVLTFTPATQNRAQDQEENEDDEEDICQEEKEPDKEADRGEVDLDEPQSLPVPMDDEPMEDNAEELEYDIHSLGFRFNRPANEFFDEYADRFFGSPDILPPTIPWRSPLSFKVRDNSWETLYTWQGDPVVVQRPWGQGIVVMVADSYLLSNEALRNHRSAGLLTWLAEPGNEIVFDESLKGLVKQPGIAGLTRQYRLHGVFAAILVVVGLFVWRQSAIFIAPVQDEITPAQTDPAAGRDTSQGLVHLARQHIDTKTLLTICFQAWKGQAAKRVSEPRVSEVQAMVRDASADSRNEKQIKTYIEICELLKQGKRP